MLVNIIGAKCVGIDAVPVNVEVDITAGIGIHLVGLADAAVRESLLRTVTALQSEGFRIPGKKIVINLAPADVHKQGGGYDVPIALGIIAASGQRDLPGIGKYLIMGELGLDASVRYVRGALPMADLAARIGLRGCILPADSAIETADDGSLEIFGVSTLTEVLRILEEKEDPSDLLSVNRPDFGRMDPLRPGAYVDLADIRGQETARRGLEIAASGGHNIIMVGPPGSGKSSLAKALPGILPPMDREEAVITSKIYSVAGLGWQGRGLMRERPFRAPHISASLAAVLGGGSGGAIVPGEVSLATNGVLFLDEFCEAPKAVTEALRAPLEDRKVTVSRLRSKVEFPASFMLVAAANPCPCGYYGEGNACTCTPGRRAAYISRLSGPLMDRIDLHVRVRPVPTTALVRGEKNEPSAAVAARVKAAREIQRRRFEGTGIFTNAEMSGRDLDRLCPLSEECKSTLEKLIDSLGLSARACTRIIRIARTIADLEAAAESRPEAGDILPAHLLEAAGYRFLDRKDMFAEW